MTAEGKNPDTKTPLTGFSGRESAFDEKLRQLRTTGQFQKPDRKTLQYFQKNSSEFDTPSLDSKLNTKIEDDGEFTETERLAFVDEASGLLNSRTILGKMALEMRRSARYKHNFSLLVLELDRYGQMDSLTPLAVEMVFGAFCKLVSKNIREVDKVGRFDEQSLLIVCPETDPAEAGIEAERLRHVISTNTFKQIGQHFSVSVSIGIASFPGHGTRPLEMLAVGLEAAQQAVALGGNRVYIAKPDALETANASADAEQDFSPFDSGEKTEFEGLDMSPENLIAKKKEDPADLAFPQPSTTADLSSLIN